MTKTAGVLLALIVVGIAVTTGTHTPGPVCPATTSGHVASSTGSGSGSGSGSSGR